MISAYNSKVLINKVFYEYSERDVGISAGHVPNKNKASQNGFFVCNDYPFFAVSSYRIIDEEKLIEQKYPHFSRQTHILLTTVS